MCKIFTIFVVIKFSIMAVIDIDETIKVENIKELKVPRDENGNPIGTPWEEVLENIYNDLSEHYGVDLRTL